MKDEPAELLVCPFCGCAPFRPFEDSKTIGIHEEARWYVECKGCSAKVEEMGEEQAVAVWNRRAEEQIEQREREAFGAGIEWADKEIPVSETEGTITDHAYRAYRAWREGKK